MRVQPPSEVSCTLHQALGNVENNYDTKSMRALTDYSKNLTIDPYYKEYAHIFYLTHN
jgi:hypothetical protein